MTLYPDQTAFLDEARALFRSGVRRVLGQAPTGFGKTIIFTEMARSAAAKGKRVDILVHREELLDQTVAKLGVPCGVVAPGRRMTQHPIQVCMVQSLARRLHKRRAPDLIIPDEAHHCPAGTWATVMSAYREAYVFGLTATPVRLDGKGLGDQYEALVCGPSVADLIERGRLSPYTMFSVADIDVRGISKRAGDFDRRELADAADKPKLIGNAVHHYRRHADGLPFIAFCTSVQHSEHVARAFCDAGYRVRAVDGTTPKDVRRADVQALARGELDGLTNCALFTEGVDVPVLSCVIDLKPSRSLTNVMQAWGRGLRMHDGKEQCIILDHAGNAARHGLPDTPREWSLDVTKKRTTQEMPDVQHRVCPACFACHQPAPRCPQCGHVYQVEQREVQQVEGDLVQVMVDPLRAARAREQARARTPQELEAVAQSRGYKPGWVKHVLRARARHRKGAVA